MDRSLTRLFAARIRLGLFDPPAQGLSRINAAPTTTRRRIARCRCAWREASMVLLRNEGDLLPLRAAPGRSR